MTKLGNTVLILILIIIAAAGYYIFGYKKTSPESVLITNFEECARAGYPVMESYPRQCRVPDGELFMEVIDNPDPSVNPRAKDGCFIGGCSAQICSDQEGAVSTCEFREEYGCYLYAICERQQNGQCGWTETSDLRACLANPPKLEK